MCSWIQRLQRVDELRAAFLHRHTVRFPRAPLVARAFRPAIEIRRQQGVDPFAQDSGERRRLTAGRDGDRDARPPDDSSEIGGRWGGSSTAFTKMRRASAASATRALISGVAADTTYHASSRSAATKASGSTTRMSAPARTSASSLLAATQPVPTTTTRRPSSFTKRGNKSIKAKGPETTGASGPLKRCAD